MLRFAQRPAPQPSPRPHWLGAFALALSVGLPGCARQADAVDSQALNMDGQNFQIVRIDLRRESLQLHWREPDNARPYGDIESLRRWGQTRGQRLLFAANAGIYDRRNVPLGLHVENGRPLVPLNLSRGDPAAGNFSLQPNGVFAIYPDGHAEVLRSVDFKRLNQPARWATQSGPMLVINGQLNAQFINDSSSMKWRSGVCAASPRHVVFAVSEAPVNFHTFARLFRDQLGCRDALYLDGTISQFYLDGQGYLGAPALMVRPYAGIFAVFAKP